MSRPSTEYVRIVFAVAPDPHFSYTLLCYVKGNLISERALIVVACLICVTLQIVQLEHHDHRSYLTFNLDGTRDRTKVFFLKS